jgi:hypothetical protein
VSTVGVDLAPVVENLARLDATIEAQTFQQRQHLEAAVGRLALTVQRLQTDPVEIDTRRLEDVVNRGALHNAADIANLRRELEGMADVIRVQEKGIGEVRATLDWIKDRLMLR